MFKVPSQMYMAERRTLALPRNFGCLSIRIESFAAIARTVHEIADYVSCWCRLKACRICILLQN